MECQDVVGSAKTVDLPKHDFRTFQAKGGKSCPREFLLITHLWSITG
jgi:hypothetical protein